MKKILLVLYIAMAIWDVGALNANFRDEWHDCKPKEIRKNFAFAMFMGLIPPAIILTPAFTGFYYSGWSLSLKKPQECLQ